MTSNTCRICGALIPQTRVVCDNKTCRMRVVTALTWGKKRGNYAKELRTEMMVARFSGMSIDSV